MNHNRWSGNRSLFLREMFYAWMLLCLNVIIFTTIAILFSLVIADRQMVVIAALVTVIPIMIGMHIAAYKRDYSIAFHKSVQRSEAIATSRSAIRGYYGAKRAFDLVISILALPFFLILFAICALAMKIEAPHWPILNRQERIGLAGRRFKIYTFRTMVPQLEARLAEFAPRTNYPLPAFQWRDDPRITRVGKFLRRTSLAEAPQLINVILGDMSFVGLEPKVAPNQPWFSLYMDYPHVRPGLTGFWRIFAGRSLPVDDQLRLELSYILRASFWLDLKILWWTLGSLALGQDWAIAKVERELGRAAGTLPPR